MTARAPSICHCGRAIRLRGAAAAAGPSPRSCSACRQTRRKKSHVLAQGGSSNCCPGHEERMARYTDRAARRLPLFD